MAFCHNAFMKNILGSPLSIHTKISTNISSITSQWCHDYRGVKNIRFSVKYRRKFKISLKKVLNTKFSSGFRLIKKGNGDSNILCKFHVHSMELFFQTGDLKFSQVTITSVPAIFDGLPYPTWSGYPIFFVKMTAKDIV